MVCMCNIKSISSVSTRYTCGLSFCAPGYYYKVCTVPTRPPVRIITGKRPSAFELNLLKQAEAGAAIKCFWLPEHLSGTSDEDTWPEELHYMSFRLPTNRKRGSQDSHATSEMISALAKYYPQDPLLQKFSQFLQAAQAQKGAVVFTNDYTNEPPPRDSQGASID